MSLNHHTHPLTSLIHSPTGNRIGTLAEVTSLSFINTSGQDEAVLMAKGRYRFRLLSPLPFSPPLTHHSSSSYQSQSQSQHTGGQEGTDRQHRDSDTVGGIRLHRVQLLEGEEVGRREGEIKWGSEIRWSMLGLVCGVSCI
jgi:Lon protease-like protein